MGEGHLFRDVDANENRRDGLNAAGGVSASGIIGRDAEGLD